MSAYTVAGDTTLDGAPAGTGRCAPGEVTYELVITGIRDLTPQVRELTLTSPRGEVLPEWTPGAHIDLHLSEGLIRQYSLCGPVDDRRTWRVSVLRDPRSRGGSEWVHDRLAQGDTVRVGGPRNNFELLPSAHYTFIAGGIGVTPLVQMAREAQRQGAVVDFLYCGRSRDAMAYLDELGEMLGPSLRVHADAEAGIFDFAGEFAGIRESTIYACGPAPMLDAVTSAASAWPQGSVRFERFTPVVVDTPSTEFDVELTRSGRTLPVPADQSILDVLRAASIPVLSSCGEGTCGTCEVAVLGGEIDHRDSVLSDEERESGEMMMICVSRCRGRRLLLDL